MLHFLTPQKYSYKKFLTNILLKFSLFYADICKWKVLSFFKILLKNRISER